MEISFYGKKFAKMSELFQFHVFQFRWAQEEVGVALGVLTEGSIEKCNQDTKQTSANFVARVSMENIH